MSDEGDRLRRFGSGFRERALGALGALGGSGSESDSGALALEARLALALGAGGSGTGSGGSGTGGSGTGGSGGTGGVLGLFKLPLGLPAFRFSGRASILFRQYFYSYGRVTTSSKETA